MISPANGSTFGSTNVTFTWSLGTGNSQYFLYVGNSPGSSEYFYSYISGGSTAVSGLPTDGRNVYVRLWSLNNGQWLFNDYNYQGCACGGNQLPKITSPANTSKFGSTSVNFSWTAGSGGSQYFLYVGNSVGSSEYFYNYISGGSTAVGGLPTDGRSIYVRIWSLINGQWFYNDYIYRASGGSSSNQLDQIAPPTQETSLTSLLMSSTSWRTSPLSSRRIFQLP
jgi:serine protease